MEDATTHEAAIGTTTGDHDWSIGAASMTAGAALLVMAVLGGLGYLLAIEGLVTPGDATRTAADIAGATGQLRLGIVALLAVISLDVLVAVALYRVFRGVHATLALLAAAFRLAYAAVFTVAVAQLAGVLRLLEGDAPLDAVGNDQLPTQVLLQVNVFTDVWDAGLVLFAFHLVLVAALIRRSGRARGVVAGLVAIAGIGYLFDSATGFLVGPGSPKISMVTFVGEVLLALWLIVAGRRLPQPGPDLTRPR